MSDVAIDRLWPKPAEGLSDDEIIAGYAPPRPGWLRLSFVESLDGAIEHDGRSGALGDAADRRVFDLLRWPADAILVGAGTVRIEGYSGPLLGERGMAWRRAHGMSDTPELRVVGRAADVPGIAAVRTLGYPLVTCEGGPTLAGSLLAAGLVDELCLTLAARFEGAGSGRLTGEVAAAVQVMELAQVLRSGSTLLLRYVMA
ncbi:dihydrofolate reductase family protein [Gryllotalpicola sp.]|uniref:dihydrofolate reductase family protein n=1 Tax=Gryllotalpicola sp. TaxID=1932787 RepID=UPI00261E441A|nr:dihydrofolate reductase family protein [Gryllotalpicola sp.]